MAYTDNIKFPWFASAGWNRGEVTGVEPKRKLKLAEQDTLYEGRINFVNSFAKEGDKIWGDKNLQVHEGIMNRISKRRLLIRLKNLLQNACIGLIFDPNDKTVVDSFKSSVKSVLDGIKSNRGIYDYYVDVDDSDEARDRLELPAKIGIKPTQILEYIDIELSITPAGVQWA
jgi:phage tail sheath protein FI